MITIAAGRGDHLARQTAALHRTTSTQALHRVVVAMGDEHERARCSAAAGAGAEVIGTPAERLGLPLARARNAGAERALICGAELLVFLDVDCLPASMLLARYAAAAAAKPDALLCGPVGYLPPPSVAGYPDDPAALACLARPHPGRPVPRNRELRCGGDQRLFWTLSFAVTTPTWLRIGGFCEEYVGYGAEDTDFGQLARAAGVDLCWVGGAWSYHQHHASRPPAVEHAADILRNAEIFRRRWGWRPMQGWLQTATSAAQSRS